jgi:hypothetical protein
MSRTNRVEAIEKTPSLYASMRDEPRDLGINAILPDLSGWGGRSLRTGKPSRSDGSGTGICCCRSVKGRAE